MRIEVGKIYVNGRADIVGPMQPCAGPRGVFLIDQYGSMYCAMNGQQLNHVPGSTGNIVGEIKGKTL